MRQFQRLRVQQQALGQRLLGRAGVERIAHDGVADGLQVHAQLVRTPGDGLECHPRGALLGAAQQHAVARERRSAVRTVDLLQRPVRPVGLQRQVDLARLVGDEAVDHGDIGLAHGALGERPAQASLGLGPAGIDDEPRRHHVEPMDDAQVGEGALQARPVAVDDAAPGHREQAGRLDRHHAGGMGVQPCRVCGGARHGGAGRGRDQASASCIPAESSSRVPGRPATTSRCRAAATRVAAIGRMPAGTIFSTGVSRRSAKRSPWRARPASPWRGRG